METEMRTTGYLGANYSQTMKTSDISERLNKNTEILKRMKIEIEALISSTNELTSKMYEMKNSPNITEVDKICYCTQIKRMKQLKQNYKNMADLINSLLKED